MKRKMIIIVIGLVLSMALLVVKPYVISEAIQTLTHKERSQADIGVKLDDGIVGSSSISLNGTEANVTDVYCTRITYPIDNMNFTFGSGTDAYNWTEQSSDHINVYWSSTLKEMRFRAIRFPWDPEWIEAAYCYQDFTYDGKTPPDDADLSFRYRVQSIWMPSMMIAYGEGAEPEPRYRLWAIEGWSDESLEGRMGSGSLMWLVLKSHPAENEKILVALFEDGSLWTSVWDGKEWLGPWLMNLLYTIDPKTRPFDLAYFYYRDRWYAILVYPLRILFWWYIAYRIWDGTEWTGPYILSRMLPRWIKLACRSDWREISMIVSDGKTALGYIWYDGRWISKQELSTQLSSECACIDVEYMKRHIELSMFCWGEEDAMCSVIWDGLEWKFLDPVPIKGLGLWYSLKSDPYSDNLVLATINLIGAEPVLFTIRWVEGIWILDEEPHSKLMDNSETRCMDVIFETKHKGYIMLVWGDYETEALYYRRFDGKEWSAIEKIEKSESTRHMWVILRRDIDGNIYLAYSDYENRVMTFSWDLQNDEKWMLLDPAPLEDKISSVKTECLDLSPDLHAIQNHFMLQVILTQPSGTNVTLWTRYPSWFEGWNWVYKDITNYLNEAGNYRLTLKVYINTVGRVGYYLVKWDDVGIKIFENGLEYDYILKIISNKDYDQQVRLRLYDSSAVDRLENCTIWIHDGETTLQINITNGIIYNDSGEWITLPANGELYIAIYCRELYSGTTTLHMWLETKDAVIYTCRIRLVIT